MNDTFIPILNAYGLSDQSILEPITSGLINRTWTVTDGDKKFILQHINDNVFKKPEALAANIRLVSDYLKENAPAYHFVAPLTTLQNHDLFHDPQRGYFRVFPFVPASHTLNVVSFPDQAFEAAFQFGKFTQVLSGLDPFILNVTIPDFHNLSFRYRQFKDALENGNASRIKKSQELIKCVGLNSEIFDLYEKIKTTPDVRHRVTHHDTKISNVLFDSREKGICVIDLDTIMPGYFISDVGDMLRTYLSPANEEAKDFDGIYIREEFFQAIVEGYASCMATELTPSERQLFLYAGLFLTLMQGLRFLTDYISNDVYYGAQYEDQNFVRAGNQFTLLKRLKEKQDVLEAIVSKAFPNK